MLTQNTNTVGHSFQSKVVLESAIRDRLKVYDQAKKLNNTPRDSQPAADKVELKTGDTTTQFLIRKDLLLARTLGQDAQVLALEKVTDTLLSIRVENRQTVAEEASELPNGDGYWMEGEWSVDKLKAPDTKLQTLNAEFERLWNVPERD